MEYIDQKEEKKQKEKEFSGTEKKKASQKQKSSQELMASFYKDNSDLAEKYGLKENKTKEEENEEKEKESEETNAQTSKEQEQGGEQQIPFAQVNPKTTETSPVQNASPETVSGTKDLLPNTVDKNSTEETKDAATELSAETETSASEEITPKVEESESGTRLTEMKDSSLDGGTERIQTQNTTVKQNTSKHLNEGANEKIAAGTKKISLLGQNEQQKETAEEKLAHTEEAVQEKPEDKKAEKQSEKVQQIEALPKPEAKKEDANKTLLNSIENHLPTTVEGVESFKKDGIAQLIGDEVKNTVQEKTQEINSNFSKINTVEKSADPKKATPLGEIEKAAPTPELNLGAALIPKLQEETLDLSNYTTESDNILKREGIKQEHLDMVDSGDLAEAKGLLDEVKTKSQQEPGALKKEEQEEHNKASQELSYHESLSKEKMEKERTGQLNENKKKMGGGVGSMETKRKEVTDHIQEIYENTNKKVQEKLDALKNEAFAAFDKEEKAASQKFSDNVKTRLDKFKEERYSGATGGLVEFWDDHLGDLNNNPDVKKILDEEKESYIATLDAAIGRIMSASQKTIDECKTLVSDARAEIDKYVKGLSPELQKIGKELQEDIRKKLDALDEKINKATEDLRKELEDKKTKAIANIEKKIDDIKESLKSTLGKAGDLLMDAAMKFFQWALESAGYATDQIMGILNKGKAVITAVVDDPVQFMSNLASAVGGGIKSFGANIQEHLGEGFMNWLTGKMSTLPIQLPEKWDLKGIMSLVMQVLGLGWGMLRGKLSQMVGEDKMSFVENHASEGLEVVAQVKEKGPVAMWDMVSEKADEIKEGLMGGAKEWAMLELVKQGIIKLVSMLNPAGAIVQAILAIYGGVMFFVNNMDRITEFVNSIINSISSIASGAISAASKFVEKSMAMTIPLILDFLAQMLNLGGIAERITKIIQRIRKPIDQVIDKIIAWITNKVKKLFGKNKDKKGKDKHPEDKDDLKNDDKDKLNDFDRKEHQHIADEILAEIKEEKPLKDESFDNYYKRVASKARKLKEQYKGRLTKGVTLFVHVEKTKETLDVKVAIKQNDTTKGYKIYWKEFSDEVEAKEKDENPEKKSEGIINSCIEAAISELADEMYFGFDKTSEINKPISEEELNKKEKQIDNNLPKGIQRVLAKIQLDYGRACHAKEYPGNVFTAGGQPMFVTQAQHYYIIPNAAVQIKGIKIVDGKISPKDDNLAEEYAYPKYAGITVQNLSMILTQLGKGQSIGNANIMAMFCAGLIAEPARYGPAHIANLLTLANPDQQDEKAFVKQTGALSMTGGGTDPEKKDFTKKDVSDIKEKTGETLSQDGAKEKYKGKVANHVREKVINSITTNSQLMGSLNKKFKSLPQNNKALITFEFKKIIRKYLKKNIK